MCRAVRSLACFIAAELCCCDVGNLGHFNYDSANVGEYVDSLCTKLQQGDNSNLEELWKQMWILRCSPTIFARCMNCLVEKYESDVNIGIALLLTQCDSTGALKLGYDPYIVEDGVSMIGGCEMVAKSTSLPQELKRSLLSEGYEICT